MSKLRSPVFLWGVPRSVSTAFEKAASQHPKIVVEHEPFTYSYFFSSGRRSNRYVRPTEQKPPLALESQTLIRLDQSSGIVLIKELAFQGEPYVSDACLASCRHLIIMRRPKVVYDSLLRLKPDFTEDEFGFTALERIFDRLERLKCSPLMTVDGDDFRKNPEMTLRTLCNKLDLDFNPCMMSWSSGKIRDWRADEWKTQAIWHRTLETSNGILPPIAAGEVRISPDHMEIIRRSEEIYYRLWSNRAP
jgi:hypothetical protein